MARISFAHTAIAAALAGGLLLGSAGAPFAQTRLPDGEVSHWRGYSAWLIDPTDRYTHAVLGDAIEAGGLAIRTPQGRQYVLRLDVNAVFEDRRVRLADLDGDGSPEAVVIKAYASRGAAVAVYALRGEKIEQLSEGPPVGRPHRWLNIAAIADVNGDGQIDIVYVQTPHIAGIVRVFSFAPGKLREIASLAGYTNHVIGSRELDMAALGEFAAPGHADIAIPSLDRRALSLLGFRNGRLVEIGRRPLPARAIGKVSPIQSRDGARLRVQLEGGRVAEVTFAR